MPNKAEHHKGRLQLFERLKKKGWRVGELMILVEKGRADATAREIFTQNKMINAVTIRIDSIANVIAEVYYQDSEELNTIMQKIKSMNDVRNVIFSEIVTVSDSRSVEGITREN